MTIAFWWDDVDVILISFSPHVTYLQHTVTIVQVLSWNKWWNG